MSNSTSTEFFEKWSNAGKNSFKPFVDLKDIITSAFEQNARQSIGASNAVLSEGVDNFQKLIGSKKIEDVVALQSKIASEATSKYIDYTQQNLENWLDTSAALSKWLEGNISAFSKQSQEAQSKTKTK